MKPFLQCNKCQSYLQPGQAKAMGERCADPDCDGRYEAVLDSSPTAPNHGPDPDIDHPPQLPPDQDEMFEQPPFNARLFTRDHLRDMVADAQKKVQQADNAYKKAYERYQRLAIMLNTVETMD